MLNKRLYQFIKGDSSAKNEALRQYLPQVSCDLTDLGSIEKLAMPEIKVLLLHKAAEARDKGIAVHYNIDCDLDDIQVLAADLVGILGNLLGNAIEALSLEDCQKKEILFNLYYSGYNVFFEVFNNEPVIPQHLQARIFQKGISTKEKDGRGYGLYNVKEIVDKYKGSLNLQSNPDEGTLFVVAIPVKARLKKLI